MEGKVRVVSLWVMLAFLFAAPVRESQAQTPMKLKWASPMGAPGIAAAGDVGLYFQQEITRRTNGAITFESYWGGALGSGPVHSELVQNNIAQVIQTYQWATPSRMPLGDFEYVFPFGPTDYEMVFKAMRKIRSEFPEFSKELADQNAILLSDPPQGSYNFLSKTPLRTVKDFEGKKVGLIGRYFGRWLPPGAQAVVRPSSERYEMLKSGVITVDLNPFDNQYQFKFHEMCPYFIENLTVITCCPMPIIINAPTFKKFSPEVQKIFREVGEQTELKAAREIYPEWWQKTLKLWRDGKVQNIKFREEEKTKWASTLEDIPAEWAGEVGKIGLPGFKIVQRWQEITAEMGFKWNRRWGVKK